MEQGDSGRRFGPVRLEPGVTMGHAWTLMYANFVTIGIVTAMAVLTPYLLTVNLGVPQDQQGTALGLLTLTNEIVLILAFSPFGVLADKLGRRSVYVIGMVALAAGYVLYPFATTLFELSLYRVVYAVGIAAATGVLSTVIADYAREMDRGKLVAISGILNGLGVVVSVLLVGRLPSIFVGMGVEEHQAGLYSFLLAGGVCAISAVVFWLGLKPGTGPAPAERLPAMELFRRGLSASARSPRLWLSYAAAFVARGDLAIVGTYAVAWGNLAAIQDGLPPAEALRAGSIPFVIAQSAALFWPVVVIFVIDRLDRITALGISMAIACVGYSALMLVPDPIKAQAIPFFILLGIGQISAFLGAQSLIGKEAPPEERGSVIGLFSLSGAVGILVTSLIGGWLFDNVSPQSTFLLIGVLNGLVAVGCLLVRLQGRSPEVSPGPPPAVH